MKSAGVIRTGVQRWATVKRLVIAVGAKAMSKAQCRLRDAVCHNCGGRGHIKAVCKKPERAIEEKGFSGVARETAGFAFTAWGEDTKKSRQSVWILDSGSTQHMTADRSQFTSYRKLGQEETIEGIAGEPVKAVGVGEVKLECQTKTGTKTVTLMEVRHVPEARANLFALRRATEAGAVIVMKGKSAQIEKNGRVYVEAEQRGGLWEITTEEKQKAFFAGRLVSQNPIKKNEKMTVNRKVETKKTVKVFEIDLDFDDERSVKQGNVGAIREEQTSEKSQAAEVVGASQEIDEIDLREQVPGARRYPGRERNPPSKFRTNESGTVWVTPKKK